jgi:hypothetical protein
VDPTSRAFAVEKVDVDRAQVVLNDLMRVVAIYLVTSIDGNRHSLDIRRDAPNAERSRYPNFGHSDRCAYYAARLKICQSLRVATHVFRSQRSSAGKAKVLIAATVTASRTQLAADASVIFYCLRKNMTGFFEVVSIQVY